MLFEQARDIIDRAVAERAFPAGVAEVGTGSSVLWRYAAGRLTYDAGAPAASEDTIFDLASLTKVIVTTTLAMRLVDAGRLNLDDRIGTRLDSWRGADRAGVTVADLLAHAGGLSAWVPLHQSYSGRDEIEVAIGALPLEYLPRTRSFYSDLGFILLGFIIEDAGEASLAEQFAREITPVPGHAVDDAAPTGDKGATDPASSIGFNPPADWRRRVAPTEVEPWRGRLLVGEVHDNNAWALGGVAGHAGLFGTAASVGAFARALLRTLAEDPTAGKGLALTDTARRFVERCGVPGSSRALGWDTMLPTSSCGTMMSRQSIGHTGFTGTSLWLDLDRATYVVLLTNRVHPTCRNDAIHRVWPAFHNAVFGGR